MTTYEEVAAHLRGAYSTSADRRDAMPKSDWKLDERGAFLDRLHREGARRLLEVGAGTGQDSVYFRDNGLDVVATDLTPAMVERCLEKGLEAYVRDFLDLGFPEASFDAVHAVNCLLHVPNADLPAVLRTIHDVLRPGGLFFLGVYGGDIVGEGTYEDDRHDPKRFFSFRSDDQLEAAVIEHFEIVDFHAVSGDSFRFQSMTLRRPVG